jgi:para-nitrobenzyl esterase
MFSLLLCLLPSLIPYASAAQPAVTVPNGPRYLGARLPGCLRYLGLPFALPPLGDLRWRAPAPLPPLMRPKTVNATKYAPLCMQPGAGWSTLIGSRSEDCLYLNVFTPEVYEPQSLPVLVFIHGGDFVQGGASDSELRGCNLVRATAATVVITIQYRLGVFGFLGDYRLAAREGGFSSASPTKISTGNYGLLDQIAALRWIKNNVGVFGGNSGKIMIFGESAGAGSVNNLLVSPLARGLFHRAVMQSGAFALWTKCTFLNKLHVPGYDWVSVCCAVRCRVLVFS